jgi:hypothetical protein
LRFLNWQDANTTNVTTWRTRKPITYVTYLGHQRNNSFYAGSATNGGSNAYSTSGFPALHSSDGTAWTSGGPKDKDTVHVLYANSATQSGTASLSIGGSGAINILNAYSGALSEASVFYPLGGENRSLATLVYDAKLNGWIQQGGNADQGSVGINNVVPPELMFQLCKEVGAHPWFISPPFSLDPATDYMAELAYYGKNYAAANATWMKPRYEPPNELWNSGAGFYQTSYANKKAPANWSGANYHDWYGKALANLGQICAQVYGGGLGTTYEVVCGVQTHGGAGASDERLASAKYIAQAAAVDTALVGSWGTITFTKQAASVTTSHVACAQYYSPPERYTKDELIHAFAYSVTNRGNSAAQAVIATAYLDGVATGGNAPFSLSYCVDAYDYWKAWAAGFGVNKMNGYEGAYSPDYLGQYSYPLPDGFSWKTNITAASKASSCVLTLSSGSDSYETGDSGFITGNPAVIGMAIVLKDVGGMVELNNPTLEAVTFAGGGSANISGANTLKLNQAVFFYNIGAFTALPNELTAVLNLTSNGSSNSIPYYVVSAGNPFQISATRGGSPITFNSAGSGTYAQEAWFITGVSGASVTLDCNSTSFTTYTSFGTVYYANSRTYSNNLRYASKLVASMETHTTSNMNNFVSSGGEFPSNYLMGGVYPSGNVWNLLEPITQSPNPPQWEAIITFNH